jgi:cyanate permease
VTDGGEVVAHSAGTDVGDVAQRHRHPLLLGLVVALAALNLRPAVASVGPVLPEMRADVPLSGTGAAVLTFAPVLCFGVLAGVAPRLARRLGIEPVLLAVMVAIAAGLAVRVLGGPLLLFVGTVVAGGAIAVGNVLVPPLVKRDFPDRVGLMMGVYTMTVSGAAAVAAGLTDWQVKPSGPAGPTAVTTTMPDTKWPSTSRSTAGETGPGGASWLIPRL